MTTETQLIIPKRQNKEHYTLDFRGKTMHVFDPSQGERHYCYIHLELTPEEIEQMVVVQKGELKLDTLSSGEPYSAYIHCDARLTELAYFLSPFNPSEWHPYSLNTDWGKMSWEESYNMSYRVCHAARENIKFGRTKKPEAKEKIKQEAIKLVEEDAQRLPSYLTKKAVESMANRLENYNRKFREAVQGRYLTTQGWQWDPLEDTDVITLENQERLLEAQLKGIREEKRKVARVKINRYIRGLGLPEAVVQELETKPLKSPMGLFGG